MPPWIGEGMAAGVRDVANLCWKLAAVLRGELSDDALDSYELERQPHVRAMTKESVRFGRIITERRLALTVLRNIGFRAVMRVPRLGAYFRETRWFPATVYRRGLLSHANGSRAVGWQLPQPWVCTDSGERARLDDVLAGRWTLLYTGSAAAWSTWPIDRVPRLQVTPAGSPLIPGTIVDTEHVLIPWMRRHRATVLAVRPDAIVFAAVEAGAGLPPPPFTQARGTSATRQDRRHPGRTRRNPSVSTS
jgi:3-(3-hydroxy-phenyl)propionate hydroxylase